MIFSLHDNSGIVTTSYNKKSGKHYPAFEIICNKSGIYYLVLLCRWNFGCGNRSTAIINSPKKYFTFKKIIYLH